jgi:hypothetical protein
MRRIALGLTVFLCLATLPLPAQDTSGNAATLVSKDNRVEIARANGAWSAATAGQALSFGERLKTGEDSRAVVRMADGSVLQLDELTTIEIKPPKGASSGATLNMPSGAAYFFNRRGSREVRVETPSANGAIRGTAFLLTVRGAEGRTAVAMIQGSFELSNNGGGVTAQPGELAQSGAGAPAKSVYGDTGDTAPWYLVVENHLPAVQGLHKVSKGEFLTALPAAIKQYERVAPQLSGGATIVRKEWARDILRTAFDAAGPGCGLRARILRSVIAADPEEADALAELAIELSPGCAGAFGGSGGETAPGGFGTPPSIDNFGNPPGLSFGVGAGGQGNLVAICHNGRTIFVAPQAVGAHLRHGDTLGACQVTPVTNR